jgi:WD40 repeat protein
LIFFGALPVRAESRGIFRKKDPVFLQVNGHKGPVNVLSQDHQGRILSAGADGFLGIWDISTNAAVERFQLSPFSIISMVLRPGKPEITLIEWDDPGLYRISAWNYETKKRLFIRSYKDPVTFINYSGDGNFLIMAQSGRSGVVFIHAETGEDLPTLLNLRGTVTFAATGRSERTMIAYLPSGSLSYWELESGNEIRRLSVPSNIHAPILMGNNNVLTGFDSKSLVLVNALSGDIIAQDFSIPPGILTPVVSETLEFMCFSVEKVYYFSFTPRGGLEKTKQLTVSIPDGVTSVLCAGKTPVLGSTDGKVRSFDSQGAVAVMTAAEQMPIRDIALSGGVLAFIGDADKLGFLSPDYKALKNQELIQLEEARNYTNITADPEANPQGPGKFILWRSDGEAYPMVRTGPGPGIPAPQVPRADGTMDLGEVFTPGNSLLSVSILTDQVLSLDTGGNITVGSLWGEPVIVSFFSPGALDAVFIDAENIIVGRSTASGGAPFLKVNLISGETVPLSYPADVGVRVYRGLTGTIYGEAALVSGDVKTGIIKLDITRPERSELLAEYQGEAGFDMADCNGTLASTLGEDGAVIYRSNGTVPLERISGLPVKLVGGINYLLAVDPDGGISWYDPETGSWLARLRLYETQWFLETADGPVLTGAVKKGA